LAFWHAGCAFADMTANLPPQLRQAWTQLKQAAVRVSGEARMRASKAWAGLGRASVGMRQSFTRFIEATGVRYKQAMASLKQDWATLARVTAELSRQAGSRLKQGWIAFKQSWSRQDWFTGIEPLPRETVSAIAAVTIVTGLVLASLIYADYYQRKAQEQRLFPSGEHPSQQVTPPEVEPEVEPDVVPEPVPVPEPVKPGAAPAPAPAPKLPQLGEAFVDRFDSAELHERWSVSDGWSNGEWTENDWRLSQVASGPDGLRMMLETAPKDAEKPLMGAEIRTNAFYRYGYFEARMRVPRDPGLISAMFTYASADGKVRPNEIDIEILGRDTRTIELTFHENGKPTYAKVKLPFDSADGFHTYGFEWRPDAVRWYADGKMIHEVTGGRAPKLVRPQQLMISQWATRRLDAWAGRLDISRAPWALDVSCTGYSPSYGGKPICS
jgi:endo-1,3-1,4-beta-glycanase ExoK